MSAIRSSPADREPPPLPLSHGVAIWTGISLVFVIATSAQLSILGQTQPLWQNWWDGGSIFWFYGATAPLGLAIFRRLRPNERHPAQLIGAVALAWVVFHLVTQLGFTVVEHLVVAPIRDAEPEAFLARLEWHTVRRVAVSLLLFLGCVFFVENRRAVWALARERQRAQEMAAELTTARLAALRHQLQPHFLFNTLNTVAALVPRDPTTAERVIERLGDLLRASLDEDGTDTIPLRREFDLLDDYLAIQAARFPDRIRYRLELPEELADAPVPPLLLQPVVENAIRHGLQDRIEGGALAVRASRRPDGAVRIEVEDDGAGVRLPLRRIGIGLANVQNRLRALHGDTVLLDLLPRTGGGTLAVLQWPIDTPHPSLSVR